MSILRSRIRTNINADHINSTSAGINTMDVNQQTVNKQNVQDQEVKSSITAPYITLGGTLNLYPYSGASGYTGYNLSFPANVGISGQVLSTDGTGSTYWQSVSSGLSSVLTVSKTPTSGQFATLTDCINYINTQLIPPPSPTNPVGISVFPGIYNETSPITIPSWVNVIGFQENTVIENGNFIMSNNSTLRKLEINGTVVINTPIGSSITDCILNQQVTVNGPNDGSYLTIDTSTFNGVSGSPALLRQIRNYKYDQL